MSGFRDPPVDRLQQEFDRIHAENETLRDRVQKLSDALRLRVFVPTLMGSTMCNCCERKAKTEADIKHEHWCVLNLAAPSSSTPQAPQEKP